jgi:hypothetical protein
MMEKIVKPEFSPLEKRSMIARLKGITSPPPVPTALTWVLNPIEHAEELMRIDGAVWLIFRDIVVMSKCMNPDDK